MSKKTTAAALALALAGLTAAPLAHSADAPTNPTSAEQKNPCGPKKESSNPCGPAKKKAAKAKDAAPAADDSASAGTTNLGALLKAKLDSKNNE